VNADGCEALGEGIGSGAAEEAPHSAMSWRCTWRGMCRMLPGAEPIIATCVTILDAA